jgi:hypothetical protein
LIHHAHPAGEADRNILPCMLLPCSRAEKFCFCKIFELVYKWFSNKILTEGCPMLDEVDVSRDYDVHVAMMPMPTQGRYQQVLTETDKMAEIGRVATTLFTLLRETQDKAPPPMLGVVVLKQAAVEVEELKDSEVHAKNELVIEECQQQIQQLAQRVADERQALTRQDQIQRLQQYNRGSQLALPAVDPRAAHLQKIAGFEREIEQLQGKIAELQQTSQTL